jgi:protein-S-isoprenylcysteine O-methyltransferase Ste14
MKLLIFIYLVYALWTLLALYLIISAFGVKRDTNRNLVKSFGILLGIILAFLLPQLPIFHFLNFAGQNLLIDCAGIILVIAGMAFLAWARQNLGINWSQIVSAKKEQELITSGPYHFVRHPMYAGGLLACIGSTIVAGGPFVFLLIFLGSTFLLRVGAEDKLMEKQFPKEFPNYKKHTKALIPFIW